MSNKRSAPPPAAGNQPPTKKVAGSRSKEYMPFNDMQDIPAPLRAKKIESCIVEFLDLDQNRHAADVFDENGMRTNLCMLKFLFQRKQDHDTDHAPAGTVGLVMELQHDGGWGTRCSDGYLLIKTISYDGLHKHARKSRDLPIYPRGRSRSNPTLKDFLQVLDDQSLIPCGFNTEGHTVKGCRDFVSQYIYRLNQAKVLNISQDIRDEVYELFNHNYGPAMNEQRDDGVGYAAFNETYHERYQDIDGIIYRGHRICRDSDTADEKLTSASASSSSGSPEDPEQQTTSDSDSDGQSSRASGSDEDNDVNELDSDQETSSGSGSD